MKPAYTFREASVLQSVLQVRDKSDVARAKRTEPDDPLHSQPLADAIRRWTGRVLKPNPTPAR